VRALIVMERARYAIVYSLKDIAGSGAAIKLTEIVSELATCRLSLPGSTCLYAEKLNAIIAGFKEDSIHFNFLDSVLPESVRAYIILSRHSSLSKTPTLTLHYPGNPTDKAEAGGEPFTLAWTWPKVFKLLTKLYYEEASAKGLLEEYSFSLEATHHGPTNLAKPTIFIEIGSSIEQWRDERAQEAMAQSVYKLLKALKRESIPDCKPVIGIGGTHYPEKHTRLQLECEYCYGHIFAKYTFDSLDKRIVLQALEKSLDRIEGVVMLKAKSRIKNVIQEVAAEKGLDVIKFK
jgi:D-aminoacyl-tRNA deacylase